MEEAITAPAGLHTVDTVGSEDARTLTPEMSMGAPVSVQRIAERTRMPQGQQHRLCVAGRPRRDWRVASAGGSRPA